MCIKISLIKALAILVIFVFALQGCFGGGGGGGGGGVPAAPGNTAPSITAGCNTTPQFDRTQNIFPFPLAQFLGALVCTDNETPNGISFSLDVNNPMVAGPILTNRGGTVMLTDVTTGAFTYTPPAAAPVAGESPRGLDSFQFRCDDPNTFSVGTETIIVNPAVMPLGDSITQGSGGVNPPPVGDRIAYRLELLNHLNANGLAINYVGELVSGANLLPPGQNVHNGYGGSQDQHIAFGNFATFPQLTGVFDELEQNPADIVLLHIGTNPANQATDTDPSDVRSILTEIGRWEDSANGNPVSVVVAQIIDRLPSDPNVAIRNQNVINMIQAGPGADPWPDQIIFGAEVDMLNALYLNGAPNPALYQMAVNVAIHPNQAGYDVMGGVWSNALTGANQPAILQSCP